MSSTLGDFYYNTTPLLHIQKITSYHLRAKYDTVESMEHTMEEPINIIFDTIEDLVGVGELAGRLYSAQKVVYLG